jgi:hypothetical protein
MKILDPATAVNRAKAIAPLAKAELVCAAILATALISATVWFFLLHVSLSATMLEYVYKFVPGLTDGGLPATFDFNALGDPRPRPLTTLLTYVNLVLRRVLFSFGPIHPSLGINWILFPVCIYLVHRVVLSLTTDRRGALIAAIVFAASPAMLDTLTNYYIPGKPLAMLMMLLAVFGSCIVFPAPATMTASRPIVGCTLLFVAGLLGLLSDETAVFIYACIPVLFGDRLFDRNVRASVKILFLGSLALSLLAFVVVAVFVVPAVNVALGQASIDLYTVIVRGVYDSTFLTSTKPVETLIPASKPLAALITHVSPGSLLETILSVHFVPHRLVERIWTSGDALPHFYAWRWSDQIGFYAFIAIALVVAARVRRDKERWHLLFRLALAFLVFVLIESVLILRLSSWLAETNYYAAYASLFVALMISISISDIGFRYWRAATWVLAAYCTGVQFVNYYETVQRHPSLGTPRLSWSQLRETYDQVARGDFAGVAAKHPFPSQLFSYGFEQAVALEHAAGRRADLLPMKDASSSIIRFVPFSTIMDPSVPGMPQYQGAESSLSVEFKAQKGSTLGSLFGQTIRGSSGEWQFICHFGPTGELHERAWRQGLMRLWSRRGSAVVTQDQLCLAFPESPHQCIGRVYERAGVKYAFSDDGTPVMTFTDLPDQIQLPLDLKD